MRALTFLGGVNLRVMAASTGFLVCISFSRPVTSRLNDAETFAHMVSTIQRQHPEPANQQKMALPLEF